MTPPSALNAALISSSPRDRDGESESVELSGVSIGSEGVDPNSGDLEAEGCLVVSHGMGVSSAPPSDSSLPSIAAAELGCPHDKLNGSIPACIVPFERIDRLEGSGTAGGRGKIEDGDVTCTTLSNA